MKHQLAQLMLLALTSHGRLRVSHDGQNLPPWEDLRSNFDRPAGHSSIHSSPGRTYPSSSRVTRIGS